MGAEVKAILRAAKDGGSLKALGANIVTADFDEHISLGQPLKAAEEAGVRRFIPSHFSIDYSQFERGRNRNCDLRRESSTRAACVGRPFFNGGFAYLLVTRGFIDRQNRKVLFWGEDDGVQVDYTTLDDLAAFNARVALDPEAPRSLHTARVTKSPRQLAEHASSLTGQRYGTLRCGSLAELRAQIKTLFEVDPDPEAHGLPMWQAMQSRTSIPGLVGVLKTTTSATASYHGPPSTTSWRR